MEKLMNLQQLRRWRAQASKSQSTIGLVPTMGALHDGHLSLVRESKRRCDVSIVSIFVNPTQFNDPKDLEKYPRTLENDQELLESVGAHALFLPDEKMLYPDGYHYRVFETQYSKELCGEFRPGHFDGLLTIVMKLLNLIHPTKAFFGEKDYQQYQLVKGMAESFFMDCEIVGLPTVREKNGLAMSSRNRLLSAEAREKASALFHTISHAKTDTEAKRLLETKGFCLDYLKTIEKRRFVAAFLDGVRLIDNVELTEGELK